MGTTITITAETKDGPVDAPTLSGCIVEFRVGVWYAEVEVSGDSVPSGPTILTIHDELTFSGTIADKRTVVDNGRVRVRLDAGSGQLDSQLKSQSFQRCTVGDVLNALVFQTGDAIDPSSTSLGHQIPKWTWGETMGEAVLHSVANEAKASWRTLPTGAIWIGEETWPEMDEAFAYQQGPTPPGQTVIWPDDLPLVRPGMVFQGKRVSEVITSWGEGKELQQQIVFESTADGKPTRFSRTVQTEVVDWFNRTKGQELDLSKHYPAKVVGQSADLLTVDLKPDDDIVRGSGLQNVPLRFGAPGLMPRLKNGARCHLGWEAADPKRPYAALFEAEGILEYRVTPEAGADITLVATGGANINLSAEEGGTININGEVLVNGGGMEVACKGDMVAIAAPTATAPGASCGPPLPGAPSFMGIIVTGRRRFRSS